MKLEPKAIRRNNDEIEVILSADDFKTMVKYIKDLEEANKKLNEEIEEYNREFANAKKD